MTLRDAYKQAAELNREEELKGSATRFVVVANPIGSCGGDYQLVTRRIRPRERPPAPVG